MADTTSDITEKRFSRSSGFRNFTNTQGVKMSTRTRMIDRELKELRDLKEDVEKAAEMAFKMAVEEAEDEMDQDSITRMQAIKTYLENFAKLEDEISSFSKATAAMQAKLNEYKDDDLSEERVKALFDDTRKSVEKSGISQLNKDRLDRVASALDVMYSSGSSMQVSDAELAVTQSIGTYIDPVSKQPINNPVRNKICNHYFEKNVIMKYMKCGNTKCPYAGCENQLNVSDLVEDRELRLKLLHESKGDMLI